MPTDLDKAKSLLASGEYTGVLCRGRHTHTWRSKGLAELLKLIDARINLSGYSAADKVVGKAAALLYQAGSVSHVHAQVVTAPARAQLKSAGIELTYELEVPAIQNSDKTGLCPLEEAVAELDDPAAAVPAIKAQLSRRL